MLHSQLNNLNMSSRRVSFPHAKVFHVHGIKFALSGFLLRTLMPKLTLASSEPPLECLRTEATANAGANLGEISDDQSTGAGRHPGSSESFRISYHAGSSLRRRAAA